MQRTKDTPRSTSAIRSRWAAIGAAVAVTLGVGGAGLTNAAVADDDGGVYTPGTPCRLVDTRTGDLNVGPRSTPLGQQESDTFAARGTQGECSADQLPDDATALVLNVTAVRASQQTFLTFWPDGERPNSSSLNPSPGAPPTPNAVITQLSDSGSFDVYNDRGDVGLIVDVVGYFTGTTGPTGDFVTQAELDAGLEQLLQLLNGKDGPIKLNTDDIAALEKRVDLGAPLEGQMIVASRLDFRPYNIDSTTAVRNSGATGAFVPAGSANNQLWATVDLPIGATITAMSAFMVDQAPKADLRVQLRVNGSNVATATSNGENANVQIVGAAAGYTVVPGDVIEIKAEADPADSDRWTDTEDDLQIVKAVVIYDEAGS